MTISVVTMPGFSKGSHRSLKTLKFQNSFQGYSKTLEYGPFSHQTLENDNLKLVLIIVASNM